LQLFEPEGLEIFVLGGSYLNGEGVKNPLPCLNNFPFDHRSNV
jgi:hypothetical protein